MATTACPDGWEGFSSSCYQLLPEIATHWRCAQLCVEVESHLACISSSTEHDFVSHLVSHLSFDVWIGLYQSSRGVDHSHGWNFCSSGASAGNFTRWAADQPNSEAENCVALWAEDSFLWRDASCGFEARCMCERDETTLPGISDAYSAFVEGQQQLFREFEASTTRGWLISLLLAPLLALVPLLCLRYCCYRRRVRSANIAGFMTSSTVNHVSADAFVSSDPATLREEGGGLVVVGSVAGAGDGVEAEEEAKVEVEEAVEVEAAVEVEEVEAAITLGEEELLTVRTLHRAEESAAHLRQRVSGTAMLVGALIFWLSALPSALPALTGTAAASNLVTGNAANHLSAGLPWGVLIAALALRPTDAKEIYRVMMVSAIVLAIVAVLLLVFAFAAPSRSSNGFSDHPAETVGIALVLGLYACLIVHYTRRAAPRSMLLRFWLLFRSLLLLVAVHSIHVLIRPYYYGRNVVFTGRKDDFSLPRITLGLSYALCAFVFGPSTRGRVIRWLGSLMASGSKLQEAALISALIDTNTRLSAADAYVNATRLFRGLPLKKITPGTLGGGDPSPQDPRLSHLKSLQVEVRSRESLREDTVAARLGRVTAFLSYSWRDDSLAQYEQLSAWATARPSLADGDPPELIWIDRACISLSEPLMSLSCLPVFLAGCSKLLVLAGPTYPSRLWCAMELFVFVKMGGCGDDIEMRLINPERGVVERRLHNFDAAKARCCFEGDRHRLLAVIEATFGTPEPFNNLVRNIFAQRLDHNTI